MYIRAYTGFGDPQPAPARSDWRHRWMPGQPPQPSLVFQRIGPFDVNKSVLTPQLLQQVTQVVEFVRSRFTTAQPIGVIRIVGHTDGSGSELRNINLGNSRMEAVRKELHAQLGYLISRILIDFEQSPGKSQPIGDNRTATGRAANRRVDVYVGPPIPKAEPWVEKKTIKKPPPPPPPPPPEPDYCWDCELKKLGGRSVRQFLMDLCERRFSRGTCKTMVDKAISGGCKGVELLLESAGAKISAEQKTELESQCKAWTEKRL